MTVALPSATLKARALAKGTQVAVTGPVGAAVKVRITVARPKRLGLKSSVLASAKATIGTTAARPSRSGPRVPFAAPCAT